MKKYKMIAMSTPIKGHEADYHKWYQNVHLPEVVGAKGFKSAQRFKLATALQGTSQPFLTVYELETDDIGKTLAEVGARATTKTEAMDYASASAIIYEECDTPVKHGDPVKR